MVGSCDAVGAFRVDQLKIAANDKTLAEQCCDDPLREFAQRPPISIHSFDDELAMMQYCEAAWPCDKTRELRVSIERDWAAQT
jgi:hypothetical protein